MNRYDLNALNSTRRTAAQAASFWAWHLIDAGLTFIAMTGIGAFLWLMFGVG